MSTRRPVVLVTGASRGIGAATARLAAERGYDVAVNYRSDAEAAGRVVEACRAAGARAEAFAADIADASAIEPMVAAVVATFGGLDALVNNAGATGRASRLDAADPATIRSIIDLNVTGAILCARAVIKHLSNRQGGRGGVIVNLSSVAATIGSPGEFTWYAASKGAIDSFTVGLGRELAREGIRVCAVSPGLIATEIHALSSGVPDRLERFGPAVPLGRVGTADEVAEAILWLMSDGASYVTGTGITVSGGR